MLKSVFEFFGKPEQPSERIDLSDVKPGEVILEMRGITKRFPGVLANDHIDFNIRAGEIHAILGENGAGKTTLMNILYGLYQPDEGEIYIRGKRVKIRSPKDAIRLGIGMVHQHFMLIPSMTVAENVAIGTEGSLVNLDEIRKKVKELSEKYGLKVDPDAKVWQLSTGEKQRVEIIKALYRGAKVLILDEPTSVLTPSEVKELMVTMRRMADQGLAVIPFITHKLPEVMEVSDRVTVLRRGRVVWRGETRKTNEKDLAKKMVGREVLFSIEKPEVERGGVVLKVEDLKALDDRGHLALRGVSLEVHEGEILGIAGVAGNGQKELEETIMGLRKTVGGKVYILGEDVTNKSPREIISKGVGYIPEDRIGRGVVPDLSVAENLILHVYQEPPFAYEWIKAFKKRWFLNDREIKEYAEKLIKEFGIVTPSIHTPVRHLSGGNIQRLILARELSRRPEVLIASQPTSGLDVAATEFIRKMLVEQKKLGTGILLISEDLDEIMDISDRIAVIYRGEIVGVVETEKASVEEIGMMMAGVKR